MEHECVDHDARTDIAVMKSNLANVSRLFWIILGGIVTTIATTLATHQQTVQAIQDHAK